MNDLDRWAKAKYTEIVEKVTLDRMEEETKLRMSSAMTRILESDPKIAEWKCRVIVEDSYAEDEQAAQARDHLTFQKFDYMRRKLASDHAWERVVQGRLDNESN